MNSNELRKRFLDFFAENGHAVVPSSPLIPDDPSVLLTTAGMQQFKPYYTGQADPMKSPHPTLEGRPLGSRNAVSVQKSFRTSDIEEVGDERHLTFFEMLGNFSFGGYTDFKRQPITYAKEFLDSIGVEVDYVTVFKGDSEVPRDNESIAIWKDLGFSEEKGNLRLEGRADNFWGPTGNEGPCGPTTEIYAGGKSAVGGKPIEIWNIVFNQYYCYADKRLELLKQSGVDTGMGLERLALVSQEKANVFETDLFTPIFAKMPGDLDENVQRIIADHVRAIAFLVSDGVRPSNKEAGYILRGLVRRIVAQQYVGQKQDIDFQGMFEAMVDYYKPAYPELNKETAINEFLQEQHKFKDAIQQGIKELERMEAIDAEKGFYLYESFGIPFDVIKELAGDRAKSLTKELFNKEFEKHQEISRAGQERKFGGHGLIMDTGELKAGNEEELERATRLHTATHLTQAALRKILGESVRQAGSDITPERLRFDFTFERKLTPEEILRVTELVNGAIQANLAMERIEMPYEEAIKTGALYSKREKYPPTVKVYKAHNPQTGEIFSQELCGGPHVRYTGEVGKFKILKEESVAAGIRRIRATIE